MSHFLSLQCPSCGASLQVAGEKNRFACQHCGNQFLLDRKLEELNAAERNHIQPTVTYTQHIQQWLRVAEYEVCLHSLSVENVKESRVLYIDVAYRNPSANSLTCRHDQWIVFDKQGYTYEPARDFDFPEVYAGNAKRYLGLSRVITSGMHLRGWLGFLIPTSTAPAYLQFSGGIPAKTVEFQLHLE